MPCCIPDLDQGLHKPQPLDLTRGGSSKVGAVHCFDPSQTLPGIWIRISLADLNACGSKRSDLGLCPDSSKNPIGYITSALLTSVVQMCEELASACGSLLGQRLMEMMQDPHELGSHFLPCAISMMYSGGKSNPPFLRPFLTILAGNYSPKYCHLDAFSVNSNLSGK